MEDVMRVEIVVESAQQKKVEGLIAASGIQGHTIIRDVSGRGERGNRDGDGLTNAFRNICFIVAVPLDVADAFVESLRPVLKKTGGMCLVSEARWLKH